MGGHAARPYRCPIERSAADRNHARSEGRRRYGTAMTGAPHGRARWPAHAAPQSTSFLNSKFLILNWRRRGARATARTPPPPCVICRRMITEGVVHFDTHLTDLLRAFSIQDCLMLRRVSPFLVTLLLLGTIALSCGCDMAAA